ncbi:two-component system, OmpR family, sensor histidine kinase MprB [Lentzea albidocapillata subsp. violacea]|uniref:histidine kinase n=1 Tax=Lentzea albidocapillata subsp. violacea TaxID=128104 RepID=A0A1G8XJL5_9PSEU|nr:HAMP domain-containing sensor histidine kinase [Lentzea albidocapillata]SDJ90789.1 two-component system, OmpR family, sensor histidine kinase MprB [Lentzea albidocapillata subsp. violacea]
MRRPVLLRGKLALITAFVVAVAIAGISVVTWLTTEHNLRTQLDRSLLVSVPPPRIQIRCDEGVPAEGLRQVLQGIQTLSLGGRTCAPPGVDPVVTSTADFVTTPALRDGVTESGAEARVLLQPMSTGEVLILSRGTAEIDTTLTTLAGVLAAVSIFGVLLVTGTGLWLTRRALAPMERLTETAEHIARTEDLTTPVTVDGHDEVGRLGRAFTSMTAALAESRRRQRNLVNDAAHELRTPLTSLRTNIDLLVRSERTGRALPQRAEVLDRLQAQSQEFSDLVTELVVLARDDRELAGEPVDLAQVIDRAVERARSRADDHLFDVDRAEWSTVGDAAALERSVLNLLDNAVKFSPACSTITVRSKPGWLTVSDEGPGVPFEQRNSAFERFWRAPEARGLPGSGLGLAIVADVVAAHGGSARFVPRPRGASVRVDLPHH